jgi:hypothetical protein
MRRPLYRRHPPIFYFHQLEPFLLPIRWLIAGVITILFALLAVAGLVLAFITTDDAHNLPHRQPWELYAQANSPGPHDCPPGTFPFYVDIPDSPPIFDQCMRSHEP